MSLCVRKHLWLVFTSMFPLCPLAARVHDMVRVHVYAQGSLRVKNHPLSHLSLEQDVQTSDESSGVRNTSLNLTSSGNDRPVNNLHRFQTTKCFLYKSETKQQIRPLKLEMFTKGGVSMVTTDALLSNGIPCSCAELRAQLRGAGSTSVRRNLSLHVEMTPWF